MNERMDAKFILERHLFWGTHDTIEYLKIFHPTIGKKTLKRIIELCWQVCQKSETK